MNHGLEEIKKVDEYKKELRDRMLRRFVYSSKISSSERDLIEEYLDSIDRSDELKNKLIQNLKLTIAIKQSQKITTAECGSAACSTAENKAEEKTRSGLSSFEIKKLDRKLSLLKHKFLVQKRELKDLEREIKTIHEN